MVCRNVACVPSEDRVCFSASDAPISSLFPVVCVEIFPSEQAVFCRFLKSFGSIFVPVHWT